MNLTLPRDWQPDGVDGGVSDLPIYVGALGVVAALRSGATAAAQTSPARNASRRWNNTAVSHRR